MSEEHLRENLSFSGCGFLVIYHAGVASCFHEYAPQLSKHKISGSSAGAIVAMGHILGNTSLAKVAVGILRVAIEARARSLGSFHPSFDINAILRDVLRRGLPEDAYQKVDGIVHISLTRLYDGENVIINRYDSNEDIIDAIICTCFIPFWSGLVPPKYKGVSYIDGGFSNNLVTLDDKTVTVSPFAGESDICPQDDVHNLLTFNLSNTSFSFTPHNFYRFVSALLPPTPEGLTELCERGFADGIRFLYRMKLISCANCQQIRINLMDTAEFDPEEMLEETLSKQHWEEESTSTIEKDSFLGGNNVPEDEDCDGCIEKTKNALCETLPKLYADGCREACNNVNKSVYNWFYSHRPIKYLSYLATPYYLPFNISIALFLKYWRHLPMLGLELTREVPCGTFAIFLKFSGLIVLVMPGCLSNF